MGFCLFLTLSEELFPFWASTPTKDGGLGFNSQDIGTLSAAMGFVMVFIQLLVFGPLQEKFGTTSLLCGAYLLCIPLYSAMPLVRTVLISSYSELTWVVLASLQAIKTFCVVVGFTATNILIPESTPNKASLGKINGVTNSLGSLMRGVGPYLCGAVYSWSLSNNLPFPFDYHFTFFLIAAMSLATLLVAKQITPAMVSY